jgi:hypothetical protein
MPHRKIAYLLPVLFHADCLSFWDGLKMILPWDGITEAELDNIVFLGAVILTKNVPKPRNSIRSSRKMPSVMVSKTLSMQVEASRRESPVIFFTDLINAALFIIKSNPPCEIRLCLECYTGRKMLYRQELKCSTGIATSIFFALPVEKRSTGTVKTLYRHSNRCFIALPA